MTLLVKKIIAELAANKAVDIVNYDVRKQISYTNEIIICSGTSLTHCRALAKNIAFFLKKQNLSPIHPIKSLPESSWILIDYGDFIIHIFYGETRAKYRLEEIFSPPNE